MVWMVLILCHGVLCIAALSDMASLYMPGMVRVKWFIAAMLLPVLGVSAYVLWGRHRWGGDGLEFPDLGLSSDGVEGADGVGAGGVSGLAQPGQGITKNQESTDDKRI